MLLLRQRKPPANVPKAVLSPCTCGMATLRRECKRRGHLCETLMTKVLPMTDAEDELTHRRLFLRKPLSYHGSLSLAARDTTTSVHQPSLSLPIC